MSMRKIMIVDDEAAIGRLLTYQLQGFGYEVCYVQDGLQALERVLLEQPDLILLDVMMPLVSGWDVCRQIRQSSNVPIIMLTGKNADADVVTGLQSGADDYVTKPFSVAQLHARIEAVLRRAERVPVARAQASPFGQSIGTTVAARGARETAPAFTARAGERRASTSRASTAVYARPAEAVTPLAEERLSAAVQAPAASQQPQRVGQRMRETRQRRGITLYQAERACRIRWEFLQAIEQENWSYLPPHQLRPALMAYTSFLGIDPNDVLPRIPSRPAPTPLPLATAVVVVMVLIVVGLTLL